MSGILRLESLTKGNTLKQGDKTPLKYRLFDADGEKLNIAGKSAQVRLVYPDFLTIGYEKDGLTVAQDDTVTFTIDGVIPSRIYHVEIIVDNKFVFPSRSDEAKFTVDKSSLGTEANIIEVIGVDAVVRKAVDLINDDPSLIIDEDKIVNDIISNTGIGSIEEYHQQFDDIIKELSEAEPVTYNMQMGIHYRDVGGVATVFEVANYHSTEKIPVNAGDRFIFDTQISSANQHGVFYVDEMMNVIKKELQGPGTGEPQILTDQTTVAPDGASHVIFSVNGSPSLFLNIKKYEYTPIAKRTDIDVIDQRLTTLREDLPMEYVEQPLEIIYEIHYRDVNGVIAPFAYANYHSARLDTLPGDEFLIDTITGSGNQSGVLFVDDNGNIIDKQLVGLNTPNTYTDYGVITPEGATELIVSVHATSGTFLKVRKLEWYSKSYWFDKNVVIDGDSITDPNYNVGLSIRYPDYVNNQLVFNQLTNYAISGSTIAVKESNPTERTPIVSRLDELNPNADLVIIAGGTNDWHYTFTPVGTMSDRSVHTFYGALHTLCLGLKKKYKNSTILFFTPVKRRQGSFQSPDATNGNGLTLKEYGDIIKEVCDYYSIPVLDMYSESGLYPFDDELAIEHYNQQGNEGSYYYTHPNAKGQEMMGKRLLGYLNQLG